MVDIEAVFRDSLYVYFECALFIDEGCHVVGVLFRADSIDVLKHETEGVWWFCVWNFVPLPEVVMWCAGVVKFDAIGYSCVSSYGGDFYHWCCYGNSWRCR